MPELNNRHYNTVYSYSGGTRSIITAILLQGVTCDTLVLISPIKGLVESEIYENEIEQLLTSRAVKKIIVYQSANDNLLLGQKYQYKFRPNENPHINVIDVPLEMGGTEAHKALVEKSFNHIDRIIEDFDLPSIPVPNSGQRESKHNITPIDPPNSRDTIFVVEDYLGGVNFTSIQMNYLSLGEINADSTNFNYILKAKKARGNDSEIDIFSSAVLSSTALMTGISLPSDKFWVNLNPWEPDRIIDDELAGTDIGRIMLEADLQMKKDFANYGNPCENETGKALWALLDERQKELVEGCMEKFPGEIEDESNVLFGAVTRYWIIPDNVDVYTNGTEIYIANSTLSIMSEPTTKYSFFELHNQKLSDLSKDCQEELNSSAREFNQYARDLQDAMILPFVLEDVNHHEKYEDLRNVYYSLALAEVYKGKIAPEVDVFQAGFDTNSSALDAMRPWSPKDVWERYVYSFENGEYMCWQNQTEIVENGILMQSKPYAAGGVDFGRISENMTMIKGIPEDVAERVEEAISKGIAYDEKDVLFGARINVDLRSNDSILENNSRIDQKTRRNMDEDSSCPPCPDGWDGPDENCICWMSDCPAGWYRPNDTSECEIWKDAEKCPPGYEGPNEKGECLKLEMQCPPGYEGPDENGYCWKDEATSS